MIDLVSTVMFSLRKKELSETETKILPSIFINKFLKKSENNGQNLEEISQHNLSLSRNTQASAAGGGGGGVKY